MRALFRRAIDAVRRGAKLHHTTGSLTVSPDVCASLQEEGVVFLQLRKGTVFRSNRIGADIWRGLLGGQDVTAIASEIVREYGISAGQAGEDTTRFVATLVAQGFLVRHAGD